MTFDPSTTAERFRRARRSAAGLHAFPGELPATLEQAYAVQGAAVAAWGEPVRGWKVGRILPPFEQQLGADRLAGPVFAITDPVPGGEPPAMPVYADGFAAAEAEFVLRVGSAPAAGKQSFTLEEAAELIGAVHVGIEIASSPLRPINDLGPLAVVSDFGNNHGLLLGPAVPHWRSSGFEDWTVTTAVDGDEVGTGRAAAFPDGAIGAVRFLLELCARRGVALEEGQWISTGAVTGVHVVRPGQRVLARFGEMSVGCSIAAATPA